MLLYTCSDLYLLQFCSNCVYPFSQAWPLSNLRKPIEFSALYLKSKLYYDRRSVGQSVWGPWPVFRFCWASPAQSFSRLSHAGLTAIFYCQISDSADVEDEVPLFISPWHWVGNNTNYMTPAHPQTHLDLHPTLGHSIHIQHRDPRTLSIKGLAHNRRCTVVCAEQSHPSGPPNDFRQRNLPLKQPILHSSHHTSKWPNINPHGDSRQQAFAKTRAKRSVWQIFNVIVVLVILVFKV
jgi:hypothetical protein